jgi:hypothetical protein
MNTRSAVEINIKNIHKIRSNFNTMIDNMKEVSKTSGVVYGGARKKIFAKESTKSKKSGSDIIYMQAAKHKFYFNSDTDAESKKQAYQMLNQKLSAIINDRTYMRTFRLTIKEIFLEVTKWYINKYVSFVQNQGTGWNNTTKWNENKLRIQMAKGLPIIGAMGKSGIFTGRTLKSLKARIQKKISR